MNRRVIPVGQGVFVPTVDVTSAATVDLNAVPGMAGAMSADEGTREVVTVDFTGLTGAELMGNGILVRLPNGDIACFYFIVDSSGGAPAEGDVQHAIEIDSDDIESVWAAAAADVIDPFLTGDGGSATSSDNVMTLTAGDRLSGTFVEDAVAATGLLITTTTEGATAVTTVDTINLRDGVVKIIQFEAGITLNNFGEGGADVVTEAGQYGIFVGQEDGTAELADGGALGGAVAASETQAGVVELATTAEAAARSDTSRAVTPAGLYEAFKPRVTTISSSATPAINTDACDVVTITALAADITSMTSSLTGTPYDFQKLVIRIKDNGTARAITWGASFESSQAALPTTTVISKLTTVGLEYDTVKAKWRCLAVDQEP